MKPPTKPGLAQRLAAGVAGALLLAACGHAAAGQCLSGGRRPDQAPGRAIGGGAEDFHGEIVLGLNDGLDSLLLTQHGAFRFARRLPPGQAYQVKILHHPPIQRCTVEHASGLVLGDIADLRVRCVDGSIRTVAAESGELADFGDIGPLTEDAQGNLYAVAGRGGQQGYGGVLRIARDGSRTLLHAFTGPDADLLLHRLALSADGTLLHGVTQRGGEHDEGTVFRLRTDGSGFQTLHSFGGHSVGCAAVPSSPLLRASDGRYYGVCASGGAWGGGVLYRIDSQGHYEQVQAFVNSQDIDALAAPEAFEPDARGLHFPIGEIVEHPNGVLCGTARYGGLHGNGGLYAYRLQDGRSGVLAHMPEHALAPRGGLALGRDGRLLGYTRRDLQQVSMLFRAATDGTMQIYRIDPELTAIKHPGGVPQQGCDGLIYGADSSGGAHGQGSIFSLDLDAGQARTRYSFGGQNRGRMGLAPEYGLLLAADGDLLGSTRHGGPAFAGAVFRID